MPNRSNDKPVTVLVVEDQELVRRVLVASLSSADGIEVLGEAADAKTALALYEQLRPQVVTLDLGLPDEEGVVLLRRLRQINPEVRAVVVSAREDSASRAQALEAGACAYVAKPVQPDFLISMVREAVAWPQATSLYGWDMLFFERPPGEPAPARPSVLVVDDEQVVRRLLVAAVSDAGCDLVGEAASLAEADALMAAHQPSLILLDVSMRDGEGLAWMAERAKTQALPPVVVVSAHTHRDVVCRAMALGVAGYLTKPVTRGRVAAALQRLLGVRPG
ncbi:MAG: response regulator [Armatimonadetes bacterium]|nr:response regulator [Armatimonadota bacterium]